MEIFPAGLYLRRRPRRPRCPPCLLHCPRWDPHRRRKRLLVIRSVLRSVIYSPGRTHCPARLRHRHSSSLCNQLHDFSWLSTCCYLCWTQTLHRRYVWHRWSLVYNLMNDLFSLPSGSWSRLSCILYMLLILSPSIRSNLRSLLLLSVSERKLSLLPATAISPSTSNWSGCYGRFSEVMETT